MNRQVRVTIVFSILTCLSLAIFYILIYPSQANIPNINKTEIKVKLGNFI
jgi:hypothetical protein